MPTVSRPPSDAAPSRIAPLSVLPVFLDLAGKRVVVAGGSDAAAWKAELLVAAGARVTVFAEADSIGTDMSRLLELEAQSGRLSLVARKWAAGDLREAAVAVCDAADDAEGMAFATAARHAGAAFNVIDRPDHCGFQFGSIVNRSPVVVGISTSGAAPILGQAVRRRIETLLGASLGDWAGFAARVRERVATMLPPGPRRRAFWEALVDRAFGEAPDGNDASTFRSVSAAAQVGGTGEGHVTFVGAGPGDPEHLTLKAVRALQAADVILFDDLVSDGVLELARREARRILVGKRAGRPSCRQEEINDMMVRLAKAGRRVVRLKSGDPMIFGRAGEEIAVLEEAGISYDVVPGITAGLALAARLGVSLTHRDQARSVRFVTGHSKEGGLPGQVDWGAIADPSTTTIFYMGGRMAGRITEKLIGEGLAPDTPVAVAAELGRPGERILSGDLASLAGMADAMAAGAPVLIGIGTVFRKRAQLRWTRTAGISPCGRTSSTAMTPESTMASR